ncbi:MAG: hypothetical protein GY720_10790, partial [bacterium]|nr:hypothetical protein [bacterium]
VPDDEDRLLKDVAEEKIKPHRERIGATQALKRERDQDAVAKALSELRTVAEDELANLIYPMVAAYEAGVTTGEMAGVLREVYGMPYDPFNMVTPPGTQAAA